MNPKAKWWAETGLDVVATWLIGWLFLGQVAAAMISIGKDASDFEHLIPLLARAAVTYGVWKLFRSFNWLKGVPPS